VLQVLEERATLDGTDVNEYWEHALRCFNSIEELEAWIAWLKAEVLATGGGSFESSTGYRRVYGKSPGSNQDEC